VHIRLSEGIIQESIDVPKRQRISLKRIKQPVVCIGRQFRNLVLILQSSINCLSAATEECGRSQNISTTLQISMYFSKSLALLLFLKAAPKNERFTSVVDTQNPQAGRKTDWPETDCYRALHQRQFLDTKVTALWVCRRPYSWFLISQFNHVH